MKYVLIGLMVLNIGFSLGIAGYNINDTPFYKYFINYDPDVSLQHARLLQLAEGGRDGLSFERLYKIGEDRPVSIDYIKGEYVSRFGVTSPLKNIRGAGYLVGFGLKSKFLVQDELGFKLNGLKTQQDTLVLSIRKEGLDVYNQKGYLYYGGSILKISDFNT